MATNGELLSENSIMDYADKKKVINGMNEGGEHGAWTARYNEPTLCMALQKYGFMVCPGFMSPGMEYKK